MQSAINNNRALQVYILTIEPEGGLRRTNASQVWSSTGLTYRFVDGYPLGCAPTQIYDSKLNFVRYIRPMSACEISVYAGHRKVWQQFIDDGAGVGLVLEDDATIVDNDRLQGFLSDVMFRLDYRSWDIIKLFNFTSKAACAKRYFGGSELIYHQRPSTGAVGYLIKPAAATRLLQRSRIYRPVDADLASPWELGLKVWSAPENLVAESSAQLGGSLVEKDRHSAAQSNRKILHGFAFKGPILKLERYFASSLYTRKIVADVRRLSSGWD